MIWQSSVISDRVYTAEYGQGAANAFQETRTASFQAPESPAQLSDIESFEAMLADDAADLWHDAGLTEAFDAV